MHEDLSVVFHKTELFFHVEDSSKDRFLLQGRLLPVLPVLRGHMTSICNDETVSRQNL